MKKIIIIAVVLSLGAQEKEPRYTYHIEVRPDGTVYHYAIDHSAQAKAKIDAQFSPIPIKADTSSIGY